MQAEDGGAALPFFYMRIGDKGQAVARRGSALQMLGRQIATSEMYQDLSGQLAAVFARAVSAFAAPSSPMTFDVATQLAQPRALRITGRGLRLAVLAVGMPVVAAGALHTVTVERQQSTEARSQPALRGKINRVGDNPISPVAFSPTPSLAPMGAAPFILKAHSSSERARAVQCLANAVYYESALEPLDGQRAVAQVVVNRVRDVNFPHSICGVVYEGWERTTGCQFSFTCDGSLLRTPMPALMAQARLVAEQALDGYVMTQVGAATHYHATSVDPWWRSTVVRVAQEGTQIFYRWPGAAGLAGAFSQAYAGGELKFPQAVIDGRAARPTAPADQVAAVGGDGGLAATTLAIAAQAAEGVHRIHIVSYMPAFQHPPAPEAAAQTSSSPARVPPANAPDATIQPAIVPAAAPKQGV